MRSGKEFRLMRKYVVARKEYEECMEDEDWCGADYAGEIVRSCFAQMDKHVSEGRPSRRKHKRNESSGSSDDAVTELLEVINAMVDACQMDGFGHVRDVHAGDMTNALDKYKTLMVNKGNEQ